MGRERRREEQNPDNEFSAADKTGHSLWATLAISTTVINTIVLVIVLLYMSTAAAGLFGSTTMTALTLSGFAAIMGLIPAFLFHNRVTPSMYTGIAVLESIVIGVVTGVFAIVQSTLQELSEHAETADRFEDTPAGLATGDMMGLMSLGDTVIPPNTVFLLVFASFNAPFLYKLLRSGEMTWKTLVLFTAPVLTYGGIRILFGHILV